jgi:hypothetical protein
MRKVAVISLGCLIVVLALVIGIMALALQELNDPASRVSVSFTSSFVEKCIAASQHGDQSAPSGGADDDITGLCRCGAEDMREDLADGGIGGLARLMLIEGLDARIQRVMDACQATPSAP